MNDGAGVRGSAWLAWFGLLAALAACATQWPAPFALRRVGLADGQNWRLWTGHLVHGSPLHLVLNLTAALVLVYLARPSWSLWLAAPVVGQGVLLWRPELASYGGLSGLLHAHVGERLARRLAEGRGTRRAWAWVGLLVLTGKVCSDVAQGAGALTRGLDLGVSPVPEAHGLGAAVGAALGLALGLRQAARRAPGLRGHP